MQLKDKTGVLCSFHKGFIGYSAFGTVQDEIQPMYGTKKTTTY